MNAKVPSCSIILPVLREASLINGVIDHLRSLENNKETEIIVVDGEPEGTTLTAIARDNVTRLRAPRGRGKQMNAGAREAKGRMLLFPTPTLNCR